MPTLTTQTRLVPTALTLSFGGVNFSLSPNDHTSEVSYKMTSHGEIMLSLANFSGTLQVQEGSGSFTMGSAPVVEEPESPELAQKNSSHVLHRRDSGQQTISFPKNKPSKRHTPSSLPLPKKPRFSSTKTQSSSLPTQDEPNASHLASATPTFDDSPNKESVQQILDRVQSDESVATLPAEEPANLELEEMSVHEPNDSTEPPENTSLIPRWGHSLTRLKDDRLLVYGGQSYDLQGNPQILSDVQIYHPSKDTWDSVPCRGQARQWHSTTFLPERSLLLAWGGETVNGKKVTSTDSLQVLDTEIMLWYPPAVSGEIPSARSGHSATWIPSSQEVVVWGGVRGAKWLNNLSVLDTVRWIWSTPVVHGTAPKPRSYHTATAVPSENGAHKVIVFGGNNKTVCFNTVHVLERQEDQSWKWSNPTVQGLPPFPRTGHSATLLDDQTTICIYGGWDPNDDENIFQSAFFLDTTTFTWRQGPKITWDNPRRCGHATALDPETGAVIVLGGRVPGEVLVGDMQRIVVPTDATKRSDTEQSTESN